MVRHYDKAILSGYVRISVGKPEQTDKLLEVLGTPRRSAAPRRPLRAPFDNRAVPCIDTGKPRCLSPEGGGAAPCPRRAPRAPARLGPPAPPTPPQVAGRSAARAAYLGFVLREFPRCRPTYDRMRTYGSDDEAAAAGAPDGGQQPGGGDGGRRGGRRGGGRWLPRPARRGGARARGLLDSSLGGEQRAEVAAPTVPRGRRCGAGTRGGAAAPTPWRRGGGEGRRGGGDRRAVELEATCEGAKPASASARERRRAKAERVARAAAAAPSAARRGAAAQFGARTTPAAGCTQRHGRRCAAGRAPREDGIRRRPTATAHLRCVGAGAGELRACGALAAARSSTRPIARGARRCTGRRATARGRVRAARSARRRRARRDQGRRERLPLGRLRRARRRRGWALRVGVDHHALNRWGCSAVHWAASAGDVAMCRWLLERGLDFSLRNQQGHCGLCKAAWNGHAGLVEWMLGAEVPNVGARQLLARDRSGISPAELARLNGFAGLAARLAAAERAARRWAAPAARLGAPRAKRSAPICTAPSEDQLADLPDPERSSAAFSVYYRAQRIAEDEQEWEALEHELRRPSPAAVRLRDTPGSALERDLRSDPRWTRALSGARERVEGHSTTTSARRSCGGCAAARPPRATSPFRTRRRRFPSRYSRPTPHKQPLCSMRHRPAVWPRARRLPSTRAPVARCRRRARWPSSLGPTRL